MVECKPLVICFPIPLAMFIMVLPKLREVRATDC